MVNYLPHLVVHIAADRVARIINLQRRPCPLHFLKVGLKPR
jgi:hypothetical protein